MKAGGRGEREEGGEDRGRENRRGREESGSNAKGPRI